MVCRCTRNKKCQAKASTERTSGGTIAAVLVRAWAAAIVRAPAMLVRRRRQRALRRMTAAEWVNGFQPKVGEALG